MAMMRTANPALNANTFSTEVAAGGQETMTLQGTVQKTAILLLLLIGASSWTWTHALANPAGILRWFWAVLIAATALGFVTVFKKAWAPVTAPLYAITEGLLLGVISVFFESQYPGIVIQAVALTFGTLAALLAAYSSGLIPVTQNFRLGVVAATGGICLVYLVDIVLSFFGHRIPMIHESGVVGIGFSLFVVVIASLNLVLDFDFIEKGTQSNQPRSMEWYGAFGLIVTLVWLYLEILNLLAKTRRRR